MADPLKLLIIDDSADDRLLYRRTLQKNSRGNYTIGEAGDGEDGLRAVQNTPPDCILLDYSLPGHNGVEVLKQIRAVSPFIPVVMLTGQGNEKVAVTAMQEGAQNYISKATITPETLEHVIRMAVENCMLQKRIHDQRTSLEVFTRALAHDLKEPMRTIRSFADLIVEREQFSPKTQSYFEHIQHAADRMHMLIDTVFLYTRLDDPAHVSRQACDSSRVLDEVMENISHLIAEKGARITADSLPEVQANRVQLIQLLQNLVCNAINHGEKNGIAIHIGAREEDDHWLFSVRDSGPGIEAPYAHSIFDPFKRLTNAEKPGAGLGLAICKKIVESHGGKIWCESTPGEGATFLFTLSKAPAETIVSAPAEAAGYHGAAPQSNRPLANILLVDDSRADIEITRFWLIDQPHMECNLLIARNGEEALAHLRNAGPIDLMLLDINMPRMDGFELLERIKADESMKNTPVVMCTGSIYDKDMERARNLGASGYMTKPVKFDMLKATLDKTASVELCPQGEGYRLFRAA